MKVTKLTLKNFRNFATQDFVFADTTLIQGLNASGKSTIIEALELLSKSDSHRAEHDVEFIALTKDTAHISCDCEGPMGKVKLEIAFQKDPKNENLARKRYKVNGIARTMAGFVGNMLTVSFTPLDLELVTDGPQVRRRFLDGVLSQTSKVYRRANLNLKNIIRNRNKILEKINKEGRGYDEIDFWNAELLRASEIVHTERIKFITMVNQSASDYASKLHAKACELTIRYKQSEVTPKRLEEYRSKEIAAKSTLIGPTRDDFTLDLNSVDLLKFGSRGQQRTGVLSLKLCETEYIEQITQQKPILLLDDIFSELDEPHRKSIEKIVSRQQTIITSTNPDPAQIHAQSQIVLTSF